jgi:hypothetical protein
MTKQKPENAGESESISQTSENPGEKNDSLQLSSDTVTISYSIDSTDVTNVKLNMTFYYGRSNFQLSAVQFIDVGTERYVMAHLIIDPNGEDEFDYTIENMPWLDDCGDVNLGTERSFRIIAIVHDEAMSMQRGTTNKKVYKSCPETKGKAE